MHDSFISGNEHFCYGCVFGYRRRRLKTQVRAGPGDQGPVNSTGIDYSLPVRILLVELLPLELQYILYDSLNVQFLPEQRHLGFFWLHFHIVNRTVELYKLP